MFPIFSFLSQSKSTIHSPDDVSLPPQERFQILSSLGQNIEISKKLPLLSYVQMKKDILLMAEEYEKQGLLQEAFITHHKFLTWEPAVFFFFSMTDPPILLFSFSCFLTLLALWNLTKT